MEIERFIFNFKIALEALIANRFRAILTSLGIIFGVAAVIAMLAIGAGTEREILEQIKQIGSNNIIIKAIVIKKKNNESDTENEKASTSGRYSAGLSMHDAENILETVPGVNYISPEIETESSFYSNGLKTQGKLIGITNKYFESNNLRSAEGYFFSEQQLAQANAVCIIGKGIKAKLFAKTEPIGQKIKCNGEWLTVVGVLENRDVSQSSTQKFSIRNVNTEVYIPVRTMLMRFYNRSNLTVADIKRAAAADEDEEGGGNAITVTDENYHQLDRLVVNMHDSKDINGGVELIEAILNRRHNEVDDYEIVVPELLLKQEQRTRKLFNIVLAVIAGISLLVGGIGIMNIMLASVLERTKEIGLRMSIGARREDIVFQFIAEAVLISVSGGIVGIVAGVVFSVLIEKLADIQTIISITSVIVSFIVSVSVGLLFGIFPARRAAKQSPMESLRYE
jgi:putative ABC transport system permease protein